MNLSRLLRSILCLLILLSCAPEELPVPVGPGITGNLTPPLTVFPAIGELITDTCFLFQWECQECEADSLTFSIYLDTVTPPQQLYVEKTSSFTAPCEYLQLGTTYYWRIIAYDGVDSAYSSVFTFTMLPQSLSSTVEELRKSCYIIGIAYEGAIWGLGSGFAVSETEIMTNAHVVNGLRWMVRDYGNKDFDLIAVQDGGTLGVNSTYILDSSKVHPLYDLSTVYTYDFGLLKVDTGSLPNPLELENKEFLDTLRVGDNIFTIGFPGETNYLNSTSPLSTYKDGTISAIRPMPGTEETNPGAIIQHNFNTTGGTSGSPIFNSSGRVIAVHTAGEYEFIYDGNEIIRIPVGSISYGVRADLSEGIHETPYASFEECSSDTVTYTFINGALSDLWFIVEGDTLTVIEYLDTIEFWDYAGYSGYTHIELVSMFDSNNISWNDTLPIGLDFERRYFADSSWFLLGVYNLTDRSGKGIIVENSHGIDSVGKYMPYDEYEDIGYFRSDSATDFRCWFWDSKIPHLWDNMNTIGNNGEAKIVCLEPTGSIPDTRAVRVKKERTPQKRRYRLTDVKKALKERREE